ncbi:MAG: glutamyl-tRNA reductase [Bacteroidetes bacterium]|nr:glutamyl-tRNA reductase [Bacteroidota bacterium]
MLSEISNKTLYNVGLSYKKADVATRGNFSISKEDQKRLLETAKRRGIEGIMVLSTCNRTEIFGMSDHPFQLIDLLCKFSKGTVEEFIKVSHINKNSYAVNHLFRIATGLESQILGDYEIVGQLKEAYYQAKELNTLNLYLERIFNLALQASKEVKNTTDLSSGTTTVSYAAIQYIKDNVKDFSSKKIVLYGLGDIGKNTAKNIIQYFDHSSITIVNRTFEKAADFANKHQLRVASYDELKSIIEHIDILIVATSAKQPTITADFIPNNKELLILDLAIPRNVEPVLAERNGITLIDVDVLSKETDKTIENRKLQIPVAEEIIQKYIKELEDWLAFRRLTPALNSLKKSLENIQNEVLEYHQKKYDSFNAEHAEMATNQIVNRITAQFAKHLKEADTDVNKSVLMMQKIFNIQDEKINA